MADLFAEDKEREEEDAEAEEEDRRSLSFKPFSPTAAETDPLVETWTGHAS